MRTLWSRLRRFSSSSSSYFSPATTNVKDLEATLNTPSAKIRSIWEKYGCLVVRGLNRGYVESINAEITKYAAQSISLLPSASEVPEGWLTPDGTLFIPMSKEGKEATGRDKQVMVLGVDYFTSSSLLRASTHENVLHFVKSFFPSPPHGIELYGKGQVLYKEPTKGHAKFMHQDSAYFEFSGMGPIGTLNYCVQTKRELNNGPLHVIPGSHKQGYVPHVDTPSHLGLDPKSGYSFENGVVIDGEAGDCIFFHQHLVHGSKYNESRLPRPVFINRYLNVADYPIMPLATSVEMRKKALEEGKKNPPRKERGYLVQGHRPYDHKVWDLPRQQH